MLVGMAVDECVRHKEYAFFCIKDMHCCKCAILLTNTNHLLRNLDGVRILSVKTGDECIGIARFYHHHTEVVALIHLVVCLLEGVALTCTLLREMLSVCGTASLLLIGTHVYDVNALKT